MSIDALTRLKTTTNSFSKTTGAFVVDGGVGIGKNLNVGGDVNIEGNVNVTGIATFTRGIIVPTGIGAAFGNIQIGVTDDQTIDTKAGNLVLAMLQPIELRSMQQLI